MKYFNLLMLSLGLFFGCSQNNIDRSNPDYAKVDFDSVKDTFEPLPKFVFDTTKPAALAQVKLGKRLYFEKGLSLANDISCNSCHMLDKFGVDNEPTSPGHKGHRGDRNSPTVYNSAFHIAQFWDGRAKDLKAQAKGPILNPGEMAIPDEATAIKRLKNIDGYTEMFKAAFPKKKNPMTYDNMAEAIANFEKNLLTPSRFDDYLKGKSDALSDDEKEGLRVFMEVGCTSCHNGVGVGGGLYQKIGLEVPYDTEDLGRYKVTKDTDDKYFFKVPTLRNVAKTGPYFHDGKVKTLKEAVTLMGKHQLGVDLKPSEVDSILAFLDSLTGELPNISKL